MGTELYDFNVGRFKCLAIRDGDANDFDRNILLIDTGQHHVLVDTGNGYDYDPNRGLLLDRLQSAGISPADIDIVIFSHADWDHIGGAVDAHGTVAFPRARYVVAQAEWDFWMSDSKRLRSDDSFDAAFHQLAQSLPKQRLAYLRDRVELINPDTEIVPGIRAIAAPGHTPGYMVIAIASGADRFHSIGDLLYGPRDIEDPNWFSIYDLDPAQVVVTRRRVFEQAANERALLQAYHLPFPGLGYIVRDGQGWRWSSSEGPE